MAVPAELMPVSMREYNRAWLSTDVIAGVTLAAVAIPETMGYTSIAQTPIVTGLYTVIFPTIFFALLGASKLLVVGADSATAAILSAGLLSLTVPGLTPESSEWVAFCGLVAIVCGVMLFIARLLRLGFLGDFLSASVLIGFLTGVGIQVLSGQIPSHARHPQGQRQLVPAAVALDHVAGRHLVGDVRLRRSHHRHHRGVQALPAQGARRDRRRRAAHHRLGADRRLVARCRGGRLGEGRLPAHRAASGLSWSDVPQVLAVSFSCFVLIIAQSAATSRSFAMKHGDRVDVNRDIIGLGGGEPRRRASPAPSSSTAVPTKTQILDEQKGRTQVANLTMSAIVLLVVLFFTGRARGHAQGGPRRASCSSSAST